MSKKETTGMLRNSNTGVLMNPDGYLWLLELTQGHNISVGIEEFEGKLVKATRTDKMIVIEIVKEVALVLPKARELCMTRG